MAIRIEYIPDKDNVFRNIHKNFLNPETGPQNKIIPAAVFHLHKDEDGLSVNWDKYCPTARHSIELSLSPEKYVAVISMNVGKIRKCPIQNCNLDVEHNPLPKNPAHSLIINIPPRPRWLKLRIRDYLREICHFEEI